MLLLIILGTINSCSIETNNNNVSRYNKEELWFKANLMKMHEKMLEEYDTDMIRIILARPFGGGILLTKIEKVDSDFWVYTKSMNTIGTPRHYEENIEVNNYPALWDSLVNKIKSAPNSAFIQKGIFDGSIAIIETKIGDKMDRRDYIFCKETAWIKDMVLQIARNSVEIPVPTCGEKSE